MFINFSDLRGRTFFFSPKNIKYLSLGFCFEQLRKNVLNLEQSFSELSAKMLDPWVLG